VKFPHTLQQRLHQAARGTARSYEVGQLHHDLGRFYASAAKRVLGKTRPGLIGLHGQTIFHHPAAKSPATFQSGEPAYLVETLRVPVVSNFRAADLAAGGQGAPLATIFHVAVFGRRGQHICVNNLGGMSNVSSIDWRRGAQPTVAAFDTGPANVLLDLAMRHFTDGKRSFDRNGAWAARGKASETLLKKWVAHSYFSMKPPKSTGRELFGESFFQRVLPVMCKARLPRFDILATLTEFTARSLVLNYRLHLRSFPHTVILTGGGAANNTLVVAIRRALQKLSPAVQITTSEEFGWPLQSIEPAAFALLAYLRIQRRPGNLPKTTGARRAALLGQVSEP
jgi:anhydro-N-acetylmuramic acid kinase